jgi:hypothetical protein
MYAMTSETLSPRSLNRATLARQHLLERSDRPVLDTVEHLVGLQAQIPLNPYLGLWSRLAGFAPESLGQLLWDRQVVRIVVMRGTLHLVTASDCLVLRPLMQPVLDAELAHHSEYAPALRGMDLDVMLDVARPVLAERPRTGADLRAVLHERFPEANAGALAYACRNLLALVQVPPRGVWGARGAVTSTTAEAWLGRPVAADPSLDEVVMRYFAVFGPATVADVAAWCRLTNLRAVVERLRPRLVTFRDERGREVFDVPDGPRPDPSTPAPPRFLPEYDNVLLSHADRTRFVSAEAWARLANTERVGQGAVLEDGMLRGIWRTETSSGSGRQDLVIDHLGPLSRHSLDALTGEGQRLLSFLAGAAAGDAEPGEVRCVSRS